jgi:hypothetical protein
MGEREEGEVNTEHVMEPVALGLNTSYSKGVEPTFVFVAKVIMMDMLPLFSEVQESASPTVSWISLVQSRTTDSSTCYGRDRDTTPLEAFRFLG